MTTPAKISERLAGLTAMIEDHRIEIATADARMSELAERINLQNNAMQALERMRSTLQWAVNVYEEEWQEGGIVDDLDEPVVAVVGTPHAPETVPVDEEEERMHSVIRGGAAPERDAHQPPAPPIEDPDAPLKQRVIWAMQRLDHPALAAEIASEIGNVEPRQIGPVLGKLSSEHRIQPAPGGHSGWVLV